MIDSLNYGVSNNRKNGDQFTNFGSRRSVLKAPALKEETAATRSNTSFVKHYKDINFDTLKERHDNFSFSKAIEVKHQVYDTLHF